MSALPCCWACSRPLAPTYVLVPATDGGTLPVHKSCAKVEGLHVVEEVKARRA